MGPGGPASVEPLGSGLDHTAFVVDGWLVLRCGFVEPGAPSREARLLATLAARDVPVPEVLATDDDAGTSVHRLVPGTPASEVEHLEVPAIAERLARVLVLVHGVPGDQAASLVPRDDEPLAAWRRAALDQLEVVRAEVSPAHVTLLERFLAEDLPAGSSPRVLCHADLGIEHVLVADDGASVLGVIDWSDASLADPAVDVARLHRDLGPSASEIVLGVLEQAGERVDRGLVRFLAGCSAIEDLAYGFAGGPRAYAERAAANLERTLGPLS